MPGACVLRLTPLAARRAIAHHWDLSAGHRFAHRLGPPEAFAFLGDSRSARPSENFANLRCASPTSLTTRIAMRPRDPPALLEFQLPSRPPPEELQILAAQDLPVEFSVQHEQSPSDNDDFHGSLPTTERYIGGVLFGRIWRSHSEGQFPTHSGNAPPRSRVLLAVIQTVAVHGPCTDYSAGRSGNE
jgi:hypothetical protein